ncbi:MAG: glycosyltransferase family 1 protein [Akkermansia sp.]|nr:glycosyltransferase family 1 protein [Akkermansia sp.]
MHPCTFWFSRFSGFARYHCELAAHLMQLGVNVHIPIRETPNENLKAAPFFPQTSAEAPGIPLAARAMRLMLSLTPYAQKANRHAWRAEIRKYMRAGHHFDVIHPTHTNAYDLIPFIGKTPLVLTVHDMTHEIFPHLFKNDPTSQRKLDYARRADRIIAISECTKRDLMAIYGIEPEKIDVIHHGNSLVLPADAATRPMELPERYVFFVGRRRDYKKFDIFLEAFAELADTDRELQLVCAGGGAFNPEELSQISSLHLGGRVRQCWFSDEELAIAYNRCQAFVYPSAYEGFGLPLLEAFSCGAPVLCSKASCFPEIAGNGADYFPADDAAAMASAIQRVLESQDHANGLRARGAERLAHFSWQRCAAETKATYQKAIDQKKP